MTPNTELHRDFVKLPFLRRAMATGAGMGPRTASSRPDKAPQLGKNGITKPLWFQSDRWSVDRKEPLANYLPEKGDDESCRDFPWVTVGCSEHGQFEHGFQARQCACDGPQWIRQLDEWRNWDIDAAMPTKS